MSTNPLPDMALVRAAQLGDAAAIVDIANHYVSTSHVTFSDTAWTLASTSEWVGHRDNTDSHRMLFVVEGSEANVVGYAYSDPYRSKGGYRYSCETTVYIALSALGQGFGRALLEHLVERLRDVGAHRAYAVIATPNEASIALHASIGYRRVGVMNEVGRKFDEWRSTELWECRLR